jgi:hypothetical protein
MSGWCVANLLPFTPRERLFCMVAASVPDVDGLGIVVSSRLYERYHHLLGHNLTFALISSAALAIFSTRRALGFVTYCALFHLHLYMDYWGSGRDWFIMYWWPFRQGPGYLWINPDGWAFYSWQNITAALALLVWTVIIAWRCRRTPLEVLMPHLDRQLVRLPPLGAPGLEPIVRETIE